MAVNVLYRFTSKKNLFGKHFKVFHKFADTAYEVINHFSF